ncbi:DEAD/DEAH box helicase family protein [Streptosporangium jomthongense]|uniref:DEAD/DEAH box helicase family protein n=1 Tax=Streptosporangium jomthongense TaxID=1193683 RepID=A0ABV8F3Y5_9ACTN
MLADPLQGDSTRLLAALIASQHLDIRLARVTNRATSQAKRMFHDKVGLFSDREMNIVGFRGSLNESFLGLSPAGNIESIDVWPSWEDKRDSERAQNAASRFERLWRGEAHGVTIISLPDHFREELERVAEDFDLNEALTQLRDNQPRPSDTTEEPSIGGLSLLPHQKEAVTAWRNNDCRGIFAHATGAGKTVSALYCADVILRRGYVPLILVPSTLLLDQWAGNLRDIIGARVILCGGGNDRWNRNGLVRAALEQAAGEKPHAVVAIMNSAASTDFIAQVRPLSKKVALIADEVHRLGSPIFRGIIDKIDAPVRLGLSATPERANDPSGTAAILDYFGGIVHTYTLKQALDDGVLAPYRYIPHWVELTNSEQMEWDLRTSRIRRLYAQSRRTGSGPEIAERLLMQLIERARIAKNASRKIDQAVDVVVENYRPNANAKWLIYCDNQGQLQEVIAGLRQRGIVAWEYHRQMAGDAHTTLKLFEETGGIVVAIRCLDEGVDIPSATHALILASSRNPREFIQRRGRVLRRAPGKVTATLIDILAFPSHIEQNDPNLSLVVGELARAVQFAEWSLGKSGMSILQRRWIEMGLPLDQLDELRQSGLEEEASHLLGDGGQGEQ